MCDSVYLREFAYERPEYKKILIFRKQLFAEQAVKYFPLIQGPDQLTLITVQQYWFVHFQT